MDDGHAHTQDLLLWGNESKNLCPSREKHPNGLGSRGLLNGLWWGPGATPGGNPREAPGFSECLSWRRSVFTIGMISDAQGVSEWGYASLRSWEFCIFATRIVQFGKLLGANIEQVMSKIFVRSVFWRSDLFSPQICLFGQEFL